jgi:ADP-ribose pyrophosphatase YjhB (NUDIX family)
MAHLRDTYCSYCGAAYENISAVRYPRTCPACAITVWANPIPVSVVLVPVKGLTDDGREALLVIRRAIEPRAGKLALVGGFLEEHETWAAGGAREVLEETGVRVDETKLTPLWFVSTEPRPNRVLLFSVAEPLAHTALGPFLPDHETAERGVIFGTGGLADVFAFPLHIEAAKRFFAARTSGRVGSTQPTKPAQERPHDYRVL